jgi:hypothetical protein
MKHAGSQTLSQLAPLLGRLRQIEKIKEKKPGIFYQGSKAFTHFHEDPQGIFADLWIAPSWQRFKVDSQKEQDQFLQAVLSAITD